MTRNEIIEILIEDKIHEWCDARLQDGLEWILAYGWKGYDNYSDNELQEEFMELDEENFDKTTAKKIRQEKLQINRLMNNPNTRKAKTMKKYVAYIRKSTE